MKRKTEAIDRIEVVTHRGGWQWRIKGRRASDWFPRRGTFASYAIAFADAAEAFPEAAAATAHELNESGHGLARAARAGLTAAALR